MSLGTILFVRIFGALLPPPSEDDREYYEVLGLQKNASEEEIRKAYRSKSLKLHPDKIAQRRETNVEEAKVEYQFVQEANSVLSDKKKRQKYHAVGCSPTRYLFLTKDGFTNQSAVLENLHNASFADKTRLVIFLAFFPALLLVQPILIAAKVNQIIAGDGRLVSVSWMVLLIPLWVMQSLLILFELLLLFFIPDDSVTTRLTLLTTMLESMAWLVANMVLALKWDGEITSSYKVVFIPVYITLVLKMQRLLLTLNAINDEMAKMISEHKFQTDILNGRQPEELDEEELKEISSLYVMVHVPIEVEAHLMLDQEIPEEAKEEIRVAASHEFQMSMDMYADTRADLRNTVIFGVPFMILLILKLDNSNFNASWWIVFLPIWIALGGKFLWGCFSCCVGPATEEAPVLIDITEDDAEEAETTQDDAQPASNPDDNEASPNNGAGEDAPEGEAATEQTTDETHASSEDQAPSTTADTETKATEAAQLSALDIEGDTEQTPIYNNEKETYSSTAIPEDSSSAKQVSSDDAPTEEAKSADDEDPDIDEEEAFNEWQRANPEGDVSAMRAQSKATQTCASGCCQTLFLVLIVAKLEQAYEFETEDKGDGGFNTMWLLTPLFVVVGILLCCCACLVYGAPSPEEVWNSRNQEGNEEGDPESPDDSPPIIPTPAPMPEQNYAVPETAAVDEPKEGTDEPPATTVDSSDIQPPEVENTVEADADMHELD